MAGDLNDIRMKSVLLKEDSMGVFTERTPRKIQQKDDREFYCSLPPEWLEKLDMAEQSEPTLHSLSLGIRPVVVQNPAIIIQPASILGEDIDD